MINNSYTPDRKDHGRDYAQGYKDAMVAMEDFMVYVMTKDAQSIHEQVDAAKAQYQVLRQPSIDRCWFKHSAHRAKWKAMEAVMELMRDADFKQLDIVEGGETKND